MSAKAQRAYVERQKARDPEDWARKQAEYELRAVARRAEARLFRHATDCEESAARERASRAAWSKRNPEKVRAHWSVNTALRSGRLVRPATCQRCATQCKPQASHDDYSKPLEVEWLCQPCHKRKDSRFQLETR